MNSCMYNGEGYCCDIVDPARGFYPNKAHSSDHQIGQQLRRAESHGKRIGDQHLSHPLASRSGCNVTRSYLPSPYETLHMELGRRLSDTPESGDQRHNLMRQLMFDDVEHVPKLMHRTKLMVKHRLSAWKNATSGPSGPSGPSEPHPDDLFYLSRMRFDAKCGSAPTRSWFEWIEPLTIYGRHPMAILSCKANGFAVTKDQIAWGGRVKAVAGLRDTYVCDTDYLIGAGLEEAKERILFRSLGHAAPPHPLRNASHSLRNASHPPPPPPEATHREPAHPKAFFFDMGTSTFLSSLNYFTCLYAQQGIAFDHIYGWEYTLLEPTHFWSKVPPPVKPHYTFFNVPVGGDKNDPDRSFVSFLSNTVAEHDFVSIKLDIDTPQIENRIAMDLLKDQRLADLVDELFFELHFRCPVMMNCGWGGNIPTELYGLKLDTGHVLDFFAGLRKRGIRAHMWV
eukprot:gene12473-8915_t